MVPTEESDRPPAAWRVGELADAVLSGPPRLGRTRLVCVDGPSGAGKSSLTAALATALGEATGRPVPVVCLDELLDGWDDLPTMWPRVERLVLSPVRAGQPACFRAFDWSVGRFRGPTRVVPAAGVLIIEGVGAARARAEATLTVLVTADPVTRHARARRRDQPTSHAALRRWWRDEERYLAADGVAQAADRVIVTDVAVAPPVGDLLPTITDVTHHR
ncbi:hypothetical protein [Pilimelia columellifera]|uniref:(d)CMP kinase n=1 Tax=Pilimelia columellifera subsp. columellifera TaxID=706583 RepID=A0ABN3NR51_9ACTN